jgi:hypothetical protein
VLVDDLGIPALDNLTFASSFRDWIGSVAYSERLATPRLPNSVHIDLELARSPTRVPMRSTWDAIDG